MAIRIGMIGVGGIAQHHLRNLARMDHASVAAMYDVDAARAGRLAAEHGAKSYSVLADMLDGERLDAVYICVPPFAHGEAELAVIERGIPFLVEKPIAIQREPAERILRLIEEKGLLTAVGYHWRYSQATDRAREALVGHKPGMVMGYWHGGMPMVPWWRKMDGSGGQMLEQTTHIVDLARYLLGDVTEVYAVYAQRGMQDLVEGVTVPDVGAITLRFASGAVGTISNSCLLDQSYTVGLDILTRDAILEVRGDRVILRRKGETLEQRNASDPYQVEDAAFLAAVESGDRLLIRSSYADAFATHLVTAAANDSAASGAPVRIG